MSGIHPQQRQTATLGVRFAMILTLVVSFLAAAEPAGTVTKTPEAAAVVPWRGSSMSYGHTATVFTFSQAAEPYYNPTWSHRVSLLPEWHFNDSFFARARLYLSQEFTQSDWTTYQGEVVLSDLALEAAWSGWKERVTGLKVSADVRVTLPTSKFSIAQTRLFTIGPSATLSRKFEVLGGLTLAWSARGTYRANRYSTQQNAGPTIAACGDPRSSQCAEFVNTGFRNAQFDVTQGPALDLAVNDKLSFSAMLLMTRMWLSPLAPVPAELAGSTQLQAQPDVSVRDFTSAVLSVNYQAFKPVGFSLGTYTLSPQLGLDGKYLFPLINRNTTLYLDATFDAEAVVASFRK